VSTDSGRLSRRTTSIDSWRLDDLIHAKRDRSICVVLPALDEEATIGDIVSAIRRDLVPDLVDDVVVVDSESSDRTAHVAATSGARVVRATRTGKGAALWQGVRSTDSDLVVFVDADLRQFDSRFVVALLGPLLTDPAIHFVKAAYDRPVLDPANPGMGGGRVTELTARPLLAAFYPELGEVLQPLAGEYAARRELLESLPFRAGYGVDIGLLLDALQAVGVDGLAQVDLHRRWHRHSELPALGRMAAEVTHTVLDRLVAAGRLPQDLELARTLRQPERIEGGVRTVRHDVDVTDLPPPGSDQPGNATFQ
jgi:glucosyl-3-phosphoglycerate synthase